MQNIVNCAGQSCQSAPIVNCAGQSCQSAPIVSSAGKSCPAAPIVGPCQAVTTVETPVTVIPKIDVPETKIV